MLYMNCRDHRDYQNCENTYLGHMEHFDAVTTILLTNQNTAMEQAQLQILAFYLDSDVKWGLWTGLSSRPMMPIATKMLLSKNRLPEGQALLDQLKISREDVRLMRRYNMFCVI